LGGQWGWDDEMDARKERKSRNGRKGAGGKGLLRQQKRSRGSRRFLKQVTFRQRKEGEGEAEKRVPGQEKSRRRRENKTFWF